MPVDGLPERLNLLYQLLITTREARLITLIVDQR